MGFLGLGRATAPAALASSLKFPVILWAAFRSLPPAFPPKTNGGGIFLFRQSARKRLPAYYARFARRVLTGDLSRIADCGTFVSSSLTEKVKFLPNRSETLLWGELLGAFL